MSYRLEAHEALADGIRRIALEQIDQALDVLVDSETELDSAIHDARKRFKKVRAVLRLVRGKIGEEVFGRENAAFRDAGRKMSDMRDSAVLLNTLSDLHDRFSDRISPAAFNTAEVELIRQYGHSHRVYMLEDMQARIITDIRAARDRVATWPIKRDDFDALRGGLKRVYRRGRKRMADAYADPEPEAFHEWRKRVKYLWYHVRILENLWPEVLGALADEVHALSDYLGDAHDLAVLKYTILYQPNLNGNSGAVQQLVTLIDAQRAACHARANPLGARIYQEKPKRFVKRMAGYWSIWQAASVDEPENMPEATHT